MTVSYSPDSFFDMMFKRWKGSVVKMIWKLLLFYLSLYYTLYFIYNYCLKGHDESRKSFEYVVRYVRQCQKYYDLNFLLGFFVMLIVNRWWDQAKLVIINCKPDRVIRTIASIIGEKTEESRILRRTFARWTIAIQALSWRSLSSRLLRRFPTDDHLVSMGLLTAQEKDIIVNTRNVSPYDRYIIPVVWSFNLLNRLQHQGIIDSWQATNAKEFLEQYFDAFKRMWIYSFLCVPLTYTQVAYLATHTFFVVNIFSRQPLDGGDPDTYFPVFMCLQFFFYMGWLQVAEALIDPYGDDDDDFEMNYLLDSNLRNAFFIADQIDEIEPDDLVPGVMSDPELDLKWGRTILHTYASFMIPEIIPQGNEEIRNLKFKDKHLELVTDEDERVEAKKSLLSRKKKNKEVSPPTNKILADQY